MPPPYGDSAFRIFQEDLQLGPHNNIAHQTLGKNDYAKLLARREIYAVLRARDGFYTVVFICLEPAILNFPSVFSIHAAECLWRLCSCLLIAALSRST